MHQRPPLRLAMSNFLSGGPGTDLSLKCDSLAVLMRAQPPLQENSPAARKPQELTLTPALAWPLACYSNGNSNSIGILIITIMALVIVTVIVTVIVIVIVIVIVTVIVAVVVIVIATVIVLGIVIVIVIVVSVYAFSCCWASGVLGKSVVLASASLRLGSHLLMRSTERRD